MVETPVENVPPPTRHPRDERSIKPLPLHRPSHPLGQHLAITTPPPKLQPQDKPPSHPLIGKSTKHPLHPLNRTTRQGTRHGSKTPIAERTPKGATRQTPIRAKHIRKPHPSTLISPPDNPPATKREPAHKASRRRTAGPCSVPTQNGLEVPSEGPPARQSQGWVESRFLVPRTPGRPFGRWLARRCVCPWFLA